MSNRRNAGIYNYSSPIRTTPGDDIFGIKSRQRMKESEHEAALDRSFAELAQKHAKELEDLKQKYAKELEAFKQSSGEMAKRGIPDTEKFRKGMEGEIGDAIYNGALQDARNQATVSKKRGEYYTTPEADKAFRFGEANTLSRMDPNRQFSAAQGGVTAGTSIDPNTGLPSRVQATGGTTESGVQMVPTMFGPNGQILKQEPQVYRKDSPGTATFSVDPNIRNNVIAGGGNQGNISTVPQNMWGSNNPSFGNPNNAPITSPGMSFDLPTNVAPIINTGPNQQPPKQMDNPYQPQPTGVIPKVMNTIGPMGTPGSLPPNVPPGNPAFDWLYKLLWQGQQ